MTLVLLRSVERMLSVMPPIIKQCVIVLLATMEMHMSDAVSKVILIIDWVWPPECRIKLPDSLSKYSLYSYSIQSIFPKLAHYVKNMDIM
jgi:hypothetical protein